ncbi:MAG: TerB N-terminal domain-containing protein [Oscillospiraceae bacterium]|nr:TerB N-terminal domain-containing protein [Oscillospiraceae bacterium]
MPKDFKKFIDTGGKSLDDIKKQIGKMLTKTAGSVVNEIEKEVKKEIKREVRNTIRSTVNDVLNNSGYSGRTEKIPPRRENNSYINNRENRREISVEADEIAYPYESIGDNLSPHDIAINEKILGMRKQKETTYNGYIVQRCAEMTFVLQGDYVADVEDDFSRNAFFGMTTPMYAAMSNSQLRTYFTWRSDVRRGVWRDIDKSYVILYVYELLNKIGVNSSDEAFLKLLELWKNARSLNFAKYLDEILPRWLKDFYAFNNVSGEFPDLGDLIGDKSEDLVRKSAIEIAHGDYKNKLDFLAEFSAYNIKESSFYSEKTAPLIDEALELVLTRLGEYCGENGMALDTLICGQMKKDYAWRQFAGAIVNLDRTDGFRAVRISPEESYCIKRGEPVLEQYSLLLQRGIIGFILKSVEARLRVRTGFGRKITVNPAMLENDVKNREKAAAVVLNEEFKLTIERAADEFCDKNGIFAQKKSAKKSSEYADDEFVYRAEKVEIDVSKLSEIREQADEIAKKLIVEEKTDGLSLSEAGAENEVELSEIEDRTRQISDDEFSERISDYSKLSDEKSGWDGFAQALSENERGLLAVMYEKGDIAEFCRGRGLFSETVFERINAFALEFVGDIVIENGEIIPDYRAEISEIVFGISF